MYGQFAMTESTGSILYSRVMAFADCSKIHNLPADELSLCITTPPSERPISQDYMWTPLSPLDRFPPSKFSELPNQLGEDFAKRAILAQPLGYAHIVAYDTIRVFEWKRYVFPNAPTYNEYLFGYKSLAIPGWAHGKVGSFSSPVAYYIRGNPLTDVVEPFAGVMRVWQRWIWLPGSVYGGILAVGLAGMVLKWRRLGGPATVPWLISVALIVAPAMTAEFDYRYVLPAVPFACLAAAMAFGQDTTMGDWLTARGVAWKARKGGPAADPGAGDARDPGCGGPPRGSGTDAGRKHRLIEHPPGQAGLGGYLLGCVPPRFPGRHPAGHLGHGRVHVGRAKRGSRCARHHDGDLTERVAGRPGGQLVQRAAPDLLVRLGQLPADHGGPLAAERGGQVAQGGPGPAG